MPEQVINRVAKSTAYARAKRSRGLMTRTAEEWTRFMFHLKHGVVLEDATAEQLEAFLLEIDPPHSQDEHCEVDPETDLCRGCGVSHGEPCPACGGRGYHRRDDCQTELEVP